MKYLAIQKTKVPVIGLGTWELTGKKGFEAVKNALKIGYRNIDTAQMYDNEAEIGNAIAESIAEGNVSRKDIFLTTKVLPPNLGYDDVLSSTNESLRKLRTIYVDLLLIHWPNPRIPLEETLRAMNKLKQEGKVKHIGVSNFDLNLLMQAQEYASIFCNQVEYHPGLSRKNLLKYCQENDIMLTAYSPLGRSRLLKNKVLVEVARNHGKSASQVALRWLIQQKNVVAIPKATSIEHLRENLNVFDFELDEKEMISIHNLTKKSV